MRPAPRSAGQALLAPLFSRETAGIRGIHADDQPLGARASAAERLSRAASAEWFSGGFLPDWSCRRPAFPDPLPDNRREAAFREDRARYSSHVPARPVPV